MSESKSIVHVCLANFFIDGYGYQENILPKFHKRLGYEVSVLASTETYLDNKELTYVEPSSYLLPEDRIAVAIFEFLPV